MKKFDKYFFVLSIFGFLFWMIGIISVIYFAYNYVNNTLAILAFTFLGIGAISIGVSLIYYLRMFLNKYSSTYKNKEE